ncbi:MAG: hypothetical protein ACSHYB_08790 [Roseibacillus sp.]
MKKHTLLLGLSIISFTAIAPAQESDDPFAKKPSQNKASSGNNSDEDYPKVLSICYETFSLPLADAAALQKEEISDALFYQKLQEGIKAGSAKQEALIVIRSRSGETSSSESIIEYIHPTEYQPAGLPTQSGTAPSKEEPASPIKDQKQAPHPTAASASESSNIIIPATAVSFETRNLGVTLELQAVIGMNTRTFDIRLNAEHTLQVELSKWGQGESLVEMPEFETSRFNTGITGTHGKPSFIGTINRPPNSKIDADAANKVWFAFVTPTVVVVKP